MFNTIRSFWSKFRQKEKAEYYGLDNDSDFQADPLRPRTSAESQYQDAKYGLDSRGPQREAFDNATADAAQEGLADHHGHSNYSAVNPNRERHY
jgi:hypothetical protein